MGLSELHKRLARLERGDASVDAVLTYENGARASLRVHDALGLVCTAMRCESARMEGRDFEPSRYDAELALLRRAERIETQDGLLRIAFDICRPGGAE